MIPDYQQHFRGKTVLVTGGAGFIGSHLARRLLDLGAKVRIIDDLSAGVDNRPREAAFVEASILDDGPLQEMARGCACVFHEAAAVSVAESVQDPRKYAHVNILGTERVLEAARDSGVQRLIFAASAAAYGDTPRLPSAEDDPIDCRSPYAASKVAGEALCAAFSRSDALSAVSLRYFNIFGPGQNPDSPYAAAISAFTRALQQTASPTIFGDGLQTRDFTYIDNVVHANLLAASSSREFRGEVINIGTGQRISLIDVLAEMQQILNVRVEPVFAPPRPGDVRDSEADIRRARALLGYEPVVDFATGIRRMLASP